MRCAPLLLALALAPLLTAGPARACSPPPEGWSMRGLLPTPDQPLPADGPLMLLGDVFVPVDMDLVTSLLDLRLVDSEGATVTGTFERALGTGNLLWWPDTQLTPGAYYSVLLETIGEDWTVRIIDVADEPLRVGALEASGSAMMAAPQLNTFVRPITGACQQEGFCGGCDAFEHLGEEVHWRVSVAVTVPEGTYAEGRVARMALGADGDEAMTILDRTPVRSIPGQALHNMGQSGGALAAWPAATACAAVEVIDPVLGTLIREATCFGLPETEQPVGPQIVDPADPNEPSEPDPGEPGVELDDDTVSDDAPGCDAGGVGGAGSTGWPMLLGLLAVLGLGRRRHLVAAAALVGLAVSGCGPDGDSEPGRPIDVCEFDDCQPPDTLPPVVVAEHIPPPILGGALATTATRAVVGDPDRDRVLVVDLTGSRPTMTHAGGQPGRVAIDAAGERAYVTLRTDGQVLVLDLSDGTAVARYPVCAAPRGIAIDGPQLYVACAGGNLLTVDAAGGDIVRRLPLAPDLRDVVVVGDHIHVSRFRQPELFTLDRDGAVLARRAPAVRGALHHTDPSAPTVAWRTIALPSGAVLMLHQRARLSTVATTTPGGYGGGGEFETCGGSIVAPELTLFPSLGADGADTAPRSVGVIGAAVLAVDVALVDGAVVVAAPGNGDRLRWQMTALRVDLDDPTSWDGCLRTDGRFAQRQEMPAGLTAVADHAGQMIGFRRDAPALVDQDGETVVALPGDVIEDTGHSLFHTDAGRGIACASCHPEGSEDGHAWLFEGHGLRRTQELRGGLAGSAPFHWTGDMLDMQHLMDEVMTRRMGGPEIPPAHTDAMLRWIDAQPVERVDPIGEGDAIAGQLVFEDETVGCAGCHSGSRLTDDQQYDVGTGGRFSTPTLLGIGRRGAVMHDSCGATLADRFDPSCGGGESHGRTAHLGADEMRDLIAYLSTL